MGISREDALKRSLEASGSVQYNVAVAFLRSADVKTDEERLHCSMLRSCSHLERSLQLQVEDFQSLKIKVQVRVSDSPTNTIQVLLGRLLLVPGEMFEKLLGTPYSHFNTQQVIQFLDEALASAMYLRDMGWLVEREAVLKMAVAFASKIRDEEFRDRFREDIQKELSRPREALKIDQSELRKALQSNVVGTIYKTSQNSYGGTEVASASGSAEVQQSSGEQLRNLDELLALGQQCLEQCTGGRSSEDLQEFKTVLVNYMSLVCENRNQLDSRLDLHAAIGDFASRVLYVLFLLEDYEGCIRWFEMGISREDALERSLEASGSVQYNLAVSFHKRFIDADLQRLPRYDEGNPCFLERAVRCLEKCCQLQVEDFDILSFQIKNVVEVRGDVAYVKLGNVTLLPASGMFDKLLGTPHTHLTQQQVEDFLGEVLASTTNMKNRDWLVEAEAVLKMGVTFASKIEAEEMRDFFLCGVVLHLCRVYDYTEQYEKLADTCARLLQLSQYLHPYKGTQMRGRQHLELWRAEALSLAGDADQAIDLIYEACFAGNGGDAPGVALPHEDWKHKAGLKFAYGRILERAGWANEALQQMEEAKALCLNFGYGGDDWDINIGLLYLLQFYGHAAEYMESALSLMDLIDPVIGKPECGVKFKELWRKAKGLVWSRLNDQDLAEMCWKDSEALPIRIAESEDNDHTESEATASDHLYKKFLYVWCDRSKEKLRRAPMDQFYTLLALARARSKSIEVALDALDAAELVLHRRGIVDGRSSLLVDVYMLRGYLLSQHKKASAVPAFEKAVDILLEMNEEDGRSRLSHCYANLARIKLESGNLEHGLQLRLKVEGAFVVENAGVFYYLQALGLHLQRHYEQAAFFGEKAFENLIIKTHQFNPFHNQMAEIAWTRSFEASDLLDVIKFNEWNSLFCRENTRDALIWCERSRTRLYMRNTEDQPSVVPATSELFDCGYDHAEELLGDAVLMCGPDTAIISYSYSNRSKFLFCYLVFEGEHRNIMTHCEPVNVSKELGKLWVSQKEPTLDLLVAKAVNAIKAIDPCKRKPRKTSHKDHIRDSTEIAKNLLSILHSILIKPILVNSRFLVPVAEQLRDRCKHLVFSPEGFLSTIPFGALYDTERGKYLIQQKTVCVVPSVRTLHRSFQRQADFVKRWEDLEPPFIAGNPKPMGYRGNLKPLRGAAQEAEEVASILDGAQLFSGEKMTKAAVLHGLCHSQVVLLSTHGIIDHSYPYGALVLRKSDPLPSSSSQVTLTPAINSTGNFHEETLTRDDIIALQGTIPAGLVVLSACRSGLGKVTQAEGVLGLGRAVLQKGAATAVLTLWDVSDTATRALIKGMFENLRQGRTVPESLQASMVAQLIGGLPLYQWAPLIAMGSPKVRLPKYSSVPFDFISTITPNSTE